MAIETREIAVKDLHTFYKNPNVGNVGEIAKSLKVNGQYRAIVVNMGTHTGRPLEVLAGNHTLMAARELGWETITAHVLDVDEDQATRIVLADNRTAELGEIDPEVLLEIAGSLDDLEGTGYTDEDLEALVEEVPAELLGDEDAVPDDVEPRSEVGDVWVLGPHRVICGDSTDAEVVAELMDGGQADAMWIDPPYGVDYVGKTKDALTIQNDGNAGLSTLLAGIFTSAFTAMRAGAPFYVAHADTERVTFESELEAAGFTVRQNLIWAKNTIVMGRSDYHYKHEPILYGFKPAGKGYGRMGRGGDHWFGDDAQSTVFEVEKPPANRQHPTMKPVRLIEEMLRNSAHKGDVVIDLCGGSGSTLLAAEKLGMKARLCELDPKFVDVIVARWEEATGRRAELANRVEAAA